MSGLSPFEQQLAEIDREGHRQRVWGRFVAACKAASDFPFPPKPPVYPLEIDDREWARLILEAGRSFAATGLHKQMATTGDMPFGLRMAVGVVWLASLDGATVDGLMKIISYAKEAGVNSLTLARHLEQVPAVFERLGAKQDDSREALVNELRPLAEKVKAGLDRQDVRLADLETRLAALGCKEESAEPTTPATDDFTGILSAPDIARRFGVKITPLESALRRARESQPDCFIETDEGRRRNEPRYLYRVADVQPIIERLQPRK
jgi:hypothetical protein